MSALKNQLRSIIQWEQPQSHELFSKFTDRGDEIKNASQLVLEPGQGCLFTYEGSIKSVLTESGTHNLETDNVPFWTTVKNVMNAFESKHTVGLWFFKVGEITDLRWGTNSPITYTDPVYSFPVDLRAFGNYSVQISDPELFFTNIVMGKEQYGTFELQNLLLSRVSQPIKDYLATASFSYAEVDKNLNEIAVATKAATHEIFCTLGFALTDFRIEGKQFTDDTVDRIGEIANVQADVHAAKLAGIDYGEMQKYKSMRDAATNEGAAGAGMGMLTGVNLGNAVNEPTKTTQPTAEDMLIKLKELLEKELITQDEYDVKRADIIKKM